MPEETPNPYDQIPYRGFPRRHAHPELLAANGTIFGMSPPPVETSRVLELGCGDGANIISIAASLPNATCIGIDQSETQIQQGQEVVTGAGLANVELRQGDFSEFAATEAPFDYIIAHGVYSWISADEQEKLLSLIKSQLSPQGVAFVSYNCYPGWNLRQLVRQLMLYRTRNVEDPQQKVNIARQILPVLSGAIPQTMQGYAALLVDEQQLLNQTDDYYIAHEHLERENSPCYFHEFATQLNQEGLQFLSEAELASMFINRYPAALGVLQTEDADVIEAEQLLDFAVLRMFRQTLICHDNIEISRQLSPEVAKNMLATAFGMYDQAPKQFDNRPESYQGSKGANVTTRHPLAKAAMLVMAESWPKRLSFEELETLAHQKLAGGTSTALESDALEQATQSLAEMLLASATADIVELHTFTGSFVAEATDQPIASPLARYQAGKGPSVTTLRHSAINLDTLSQHLIQLCDGTHDLDAMITSVESLVSEGKFVLQDQGLAAHGDDVKPLAEQHVRARLNNMARNAIFLG